MICLTRLSGEHFALNEDLIERVEPNADTTVFTTNGNVYTVTETVDEIIAAVHTTKASILSLASGRRLTLLGPAGTAGER